MNNDELAAHVAAETSVTRAAAARTVEAVFSAIGASRTPSFKAAKVLRDAVNDRRGAGAGPLAATSRDVCCRQELGVDLAIRHTRDRLRRPAVDIGSLARECLYMASRRTAPTTALRDSARG